MNRFIPQLSIYLGRQFLGALGAVLAVFVGLILLFDSVELLRRTVRAEGADLFTIIGLALLKSPHTMEDTLPFAMMIAVMFALFRLARNNELVIIRSAGVSVWQVLAPAIIVAALMGLVSFTVFNPLAAGLYATYDRLKEGLVRADAAALEIGDGGFWLREVKDGRAVIVHAQAVRQNISSLSLTGVTILVTSEKNELIRRVEAESGQLLEGKFVLENAWELVPAQPGVRQATYTQPTTITLTQIQDSFGDPDMLSFWELPDFIASSQASGFSALPHRLHLQALVATPIMLCAMVLLAAVFFLTSQARLAGWTVRAALGVGAGFLLYFFSQFTYALGLATTLPVLLAAWAPSVVALLVCLAYLFYREDG